jgi:parallel beta-helix repeat protein
MFHHLMATEPDRGLVWVRLVECAVEPLLAAHLGIDAVGKPFEQVMADLTRALEDRSAAAPQPAAQPARPTGYAHIVDWRSGQGDHTTITTAIAAARPGERILVRKGLYEGALMMDKPLEIVGDGQPGDVEVRASGADVITFTAAQGRVANLTLRQTGGGDFYGVNIAAGRLELEDCDISSQSKACVAIHDGGDPRVRRCRIHDSATGGGVYVYDKGQGVIEDCDIFGATVVAIEIIGQGSSAVVRHSRIHNNPGGVYVREQGQSLIEDCDIFDNTCAGVTVGAGSAPTVRKCRIHDNKEDGVLLWEPGQGLFEDCDIFANTFAGVEVRTGGAPTMRKCRIQKNGYQAIWIYDKSGGVYEENDLRDNQLGAWSIADDSKDKVTRRGNIE